MLRVNATPVTLPSPVAGFKAKAPADLLPRKEPAMLGESKMVEIATPVSFAGFTQATLDQFGPQLRAAGLEPRQGLSGGGNPQAGNPADLRPGSMISVQLMSGDMSVSAEGTVTAVDGDRIYAFGHRFLEAGSTALPFARAEVLALLPNVSASFKISASQIGRASCRERV